MSKVMTRRTMLSAALAGVAIVNVPARADDKPSEKLTLQSGYSDRWLVAGARRVSLSVTLDGKGGGLGTLTLDPNISDGFRSTAIAIRDIPVRVQLIHDEEQAAKGRRVYELKNDGLEGKAEAGGEHWFLIKPLNEGTACMLVFADKHSRFQDVLVVE